MTESADARGNGVRMILLLKKFIGRVKKGQVITPLYLAYYFAYLKLFDLIYRTNFCNSQTPDEFGTQYRLGSTGNFPVSPRVIKKLIRMSNLPHTAKIIDVGHGSGLPLFVLSKMGYKNLFGVEHGLIPFRISQKNLNNGIADIQFGDAFDINFELYDAVVFCSPFRGALYRYVAGEYQYNHNGGTSY